MAFVPQDDFSIAKSHYQDVQAQPSETVTLFEERLDHAEKRVDRLNTQRHNFKKSLADLGRLEVERYVALKSHFNGEELNGRLKREAKMFELKGANLRESIALTTADLEDAKQRLNRLEIDLRLAKIEQGLVEKPNESSGEDVFNRLAEQSKNLLLTRALAVSYLEWTVVPRSWVQADLEVKE
jgi:hypothetical protein